MAAHLVSETQANADVGGKATAGPKQMQHLQTIIHSMGLSCVLEARLGYCPYFQLRRCSQHRFLEKVIATPNKSQLTDENRGCKSRLC